MDKLSDNLKICLFILGFFILNMVQSVYTGLHPDEAYYWMYAKHLDFGYFDHPPFVALFIKFGEVLKFNLGVRIATCIAFSVSIFFFWQIVKTYRVKANFYILIFSSVLLFHVYGFITTPDAPLFLFCSLFLFAYQQFLKKQTYLLSVLLGIIAAALLYSKYHGILILAFILLSNLSLLKNFKFYIIVTIALLLFLPHIYWQYHHNFPSVQYHLSDRANSDYKLSSTIEYILNLLIVSGPLTGWFLYVLAFKVKTRNDKFIKALKFCLYGTILFFLASTFKGRVQAHWPLIAFVELIILACIATVRNERIIKKPILRKLFILNICLIIIARIIVAFPPDVLKTNKFLSLYTDYEDWAETIKNKSKLFPILFLDGFQKPSLYNYYTQSEQSTAYNSYYYRKTQYDFYSLEDSIRNKKIYYITQNKMPFIEQEPIKTNKEVLWGSFIDKVQLYQKVNFISQDNSDRWVKNETRKILFKIENPYNQDINFKSTINNNKEFKIFYVIMKKDKIIKEVNFSQDFSKLKIKSKKSVYVQLKFTSLSESGNYKYFIVIKSFPFPGSRNSSMMKMNIK